MISLAQQLAEKLHGCIRSYGQGEASARAKDAFDTVATARLVPVPTSDVLLHACRVTFTRRGDTLPHVIDDLRETWHSTPTRLLADCPVAVADNATHLHALFAAFWQPLLHDPPAPRSRFDACTWTWRSES